MRATLNRRQPHVSILAGSIRQTFAGHQFDRLPVLSEELGRFVNVGCLHLDAASPPPAAVRYLKMKGKVSRLRVFMDRLMIAAHSVSPCFASNWDTLNLQIGFSYGAIVAQGVSYERLASSTFLGERHRDPPPPEKAWVNPHSTAHFLGAGPKPSEPGW